MDPIAKLAKRLRSPRAVQKFIRALPYNRELRGETLLSAKAALRRGSIHCLEATFLAAAILEHHGYPPLALSMESQDRLDHVVFVFRQKGRWGAIARSRDRGLNSRAPIFRSIRDLAWSFYDPYVDKTGKLTAYRLVHLDETKSDWRNSKRSLWKAENYLAKIRHKKLHSSKRRYLRLLKAYLKDGPLSKGRGWMK